MYPGNHGHSFFVVYSVCIVCGYQGQDLEGLYPKDRRSSISNRRRKSGPVMIDFDLDIRSESRGFFDPFFDRFLTLVGMLPNRK